MSRIASIRSDDDEVHNPKLNSTEQLPVVMRAVTPPLPPTNSYVDLPSSRPSTVVSFTFSETEKVFWVANFLPWTYLPSLHLESSVLHAVTTWFAARAWQALNRAWYPESHSLKTSFHVKVYAHSSKLRGGLELKAGVFFFCSNLENLDPSQDWPAFQAYVNDKIAELYRDRIVTTLCDLCLILWCLSDLPVGHVQLPYDNDQLGTYRLPNHFLQPELRQAIYGGNGDETLNPHPLRSAIRAIDFVLRAHLISRCGDRVLPCRYIPRETRAAIDVTYMIRADAARTRGIVWLRWVGAQGMQQFDKLLLAGGHYAYQEVVADVGSSDEDSDWDEMYDFDEMSFSGSGDSCFGGEELSSDGF